MKREFLIGNLIKIGPRIPQPVNNYLEKVALETDVAKYDLVYYGISTILPSFSEVIGKENYTELIIYLQQKIINLQAEESFGYCNAISKLLLTNNTTVAKNLVEYCFDDLNTVEKHSLIRLISFKDSFVKEIVRDVLSSNQIKEKYQQSFVKVNQSMKNIFNK